MDDDSTSFIYQQAATVFTGVEKGRASGTIGNIVFRAKKLGANYNGIKITIAQLANDAFIIAIGEEQFRLTGVTDAGVFASKFNSSEYFRSNFWVHNNDTNPVATGFVVTSGGINLDNFRNLRYSYSSLSDGGLFIPDNFKHNLVLTQLEGTFSGIVSQIELNCYVISLTNGLEPIVAESSIFYCTKLDSTHTSFVVTDCKIQLAPFRAIKVVFSLPGNLRLTFRRESPVPNNN